MNNNTLFHKDFNIMIAGQIISLFGNALLRFALPLHILSLTGSAAAFGATLAATSLPSILCSPVSGFAADRVNRKVIMVVLDFITCGIISILGFLQTSDNFIVFISAALIMLSVIQAFYQPAVQASIPCLVQEEHLVSANAIVTQVNSLSNLLGPIAGGLLYGILGLTPIIFISTFSFFISAVMELFMHIPFKYVAVKAPIYKLVAADFKLSIDFFKNKIIFIQLALLIAAFNLFFDSMMLVGIPHIIKNVLKLNDQLYGFTQGALSLGALSGGLFVTIYGKQLQMNKAYLLFGSTIFTLFPIGFASLFSINTMTFYCIITLCGFCFMAVQTIFGILNYAYIQKNTPNHLIGKTMAYLLALCYSSKPIGQALYGFIFEIFPSNIFLIVTVTSIINIAVTLLARRILSKIPSDENIAAKKNHITC